MSGTTVLKICDQCIVFRRMVSRQMLKAVDLQKKMSILICQGLYKEWCSELFVFTSSMGQGLFTSSSW